MKRVRRWLFNLLSALSLAICLATVGLDVWSYWARPRAGWLDSGRTSYSIDFLSGQCVLQMQFSAFYVVRSPGWIQIWPLMPVSGIPKETLLNRIGFWLKAQDETSFAQRPLPNHWQTPVWFGWVGLPRDKPIVNRQIAVPIWAISLISAVLPARWITNRIRSRRRAKAGCCTACGYDLRATPERCPECGTVSARIQNPVELEDR